MKGSQGKASGEGETNNKVLGQERWRGGGLRRQ